MIVLSITLSEIFYWVCLLSVFDSVMFTNVQGLCHSLVLIWLKVAVRIVITAIVKCHFYVIILLYSNRDFNSK